MNQQYQLVLTDDEDPVDRIVEDMDSFDRLADVMYSGDRPSLRHSLRRSALKRRTFILIHDATGIGCNRIYTGQELFEKFQNKETIHYVG